MSVRVPLVGQLLPTVAARPRGTGLRTHGQLRLWVGPRSRGVGGRTWSGSPRGRGDGAREHRAAARAARGLTVSSRGLPRPIGRSEVRPAAVTADMIRTRRSPGFSHLPAALSPSGSPVDPATCSLLLTLLERPGYLIQLPLL